MTLELPKLKYAEDALEPHISRETVKYHYGTHTKKYFDITNQLITGTAYEGKELHELISKDTMTKMGNVLFNNACQAYNHAFYWDCLTPASQSGNPSDELLEAIKDDFQTFALFKTEFTETAVNHFGSGWTWLTFRGGKLHIKNSPNAGCPLTTPNQTPLLVCDVWEHSYYTQYPADRKAYVDAFWNVINWNFVSDNFAAIKG